MKRLLFLGFLCAFTAFSQVTKSDGPISWQTSTSEIAIAGAYTAQGFDLTAINEEDKHNDALKDTPWRFGFKYATSITYQPSESVQFGNGDRIWKYQISCPGALTINLLLENFHLPEGARLHLYATDNSNFVGAYTSINNRDEGMLGTELVHGSSIIVEYFEPASAQFSGTFTIASVVHGYRSLDPIQSELSKTLNSSGDCEYDVACTLGNGWEDEIRAVAMIIVNGNSICTGALINNACEDGRPLFLSANHCLTSSTSNWAFRFNWKAAPGSETCATVGTTIDPGPPYDQTANGATVLASGSEADFLLLELDQLTPTNILDWNLFFVGWDRSDNTSLTNATVIHHPAGDVMKISKENDAPYHNNVSSTSVWWIDNYEFGTTEGGSSGAPLFDQNHRVVGQLYGGTANCAGTNPNGNSDYYGRLGVAWNNGLDSILGSATCGMPLVMDGWEPDAPDVFDDANVQFIDAPVGTICSDAFVPQIILRNAGDNALTSCVLHYFVDAGPALSQNWTGNLAPNAFETVTFPSMTASDGAHVFTVYSDQPNGLIDNNNVNDTVSGGFSLAQGTAETHILIDTDCYGYETAWVIKDGSNTIVASGGNALVPPGGNQTALPSNPNSYPNDTSIDEKLCLAEGCYTFTVYDDWGDGLEGTTQAGCNVDGNYTITDGTGTVGMLQNVAFGASESISICVQEVGLVENEFALVKLYPNPTSQWLFVQVPDVPSSQGTTYQIYDQAGKLIQTAKFTDTKINVSLLAPGSYLFKILEVSAAPTNFIILR